MFDKTYVGQAVLGSFSAPTALNSWSKVIINVDDDTSYEAGTGTGRALTATIPYGTPQVEVRGVYGGIYKRDRKLDKLYSADIAAPGDEEIDHEYPYQSSQTRQIVRERRQTKASFRVLSDSISAEVSARIEQGNALTSRLDIQSDQISARVTRTGGSSSSFGWELLDDSWTVKANNTTVFQITKSGAEVRGKITALSGKIGGFDIQSDYLSYNNQVWNGTNSRGVYIGVNGIQCGSEANGVQITPTGNLYAENGYFNGGGITSGSISGGYGGQIYGGSIGNYAVSGGINTSLGYADFANGVFNGWNTASYVDTSVLFASSFYFKDEEVAWRTIKDGNGLSQTVLVRA